MKIDFEFDTQYGVFRDALHLPDDHGLSETEIETMKQERLNNWLAVVSAPPVEEPAQDYIEIDGVRYVKAVE